jgi:hypothetical protein
MFIRTTYVALPLERQKPVHHESELHILQGEIKGVSAYTADYDEKHAERQTRYT